MLDLGLRIGISVTLTEFGALSEFVNVTEIPYLLSMDKASALAAHPVAIVEIH